MPVTEGISEEGPKGPPDTDQDLLEGFSALDISERNSDIPLQPIINKNADDLKKLIDERSASPKKVVERGVEVEDDVLDGQPFLDQGSGGGAQTGHVTVQKDGGHYDYSHNNHIPIHPPPQYPGISPSDGRNMSDQEKYWRLNPFQQTGQYPPFQGPPMQLFQRPFQDRALQPGSLPAFDISCITYTHDKVCPKVSQSLPSEIQQQRLGRIVLPEGTNVMGSNGFAPQHAFINHHQTNYTHGQINPQGMTEAEALDMALQWSLDMTKEYENRNMRNQESEQSDQPSHQSCPWSKPSSGSSSSLPSSDIDTDGESLCPPSAYAVDYFPSTKAWSNDNSADTTGKKRKKASSDNMTMEVSQNKSPKSDDHQDAEDAGFCVVTEKEIEDIPNTHGQISLSQRPMSTSSGSHPNNIWRSSPVHIPEQRNSLLNSSDLFSQTSTVSQRMIPQMQVPVAVSDLFSSPNQYNDNINASRETYASQSSSQNNACVISQCSAPSKSTDSLHPHFSSIQDLMYPGSFPTDECSSYQSQQNNISQSFIQQLPSGTGDHGLTVYPGQSPDLSSVPSAGPPPEFTHAVPRLEDIVPSPDTYVSESEDEQQEKLNNTLVHYISDLSEEEMITVYQNNKQFVQNNVNTRNLLLQTPLYVAVMTRNCAAAALFIKLGADPSLQGMEEKSEVMQAPLHKAIVLGEAKMVDILLSSKDINIEQQRIFDRKTPLMVALHGHSCEREDRDRRLIIRLLIERGANIDKLDDQSDKTVLMMAIETRDVGLVEYILKYVGVGATRDLINRPNRVGNTSLHIAAGLKQLDKDDHLDLLKMLIFFGGNTDAVNVDNKTPKDWKKYLFDEVKRSIPYQPDTD